MTTAIIDQASDEKQAVTLLDQARAIVIVTNEDRMFAENFIQELSEAEKKRFAYLDPERASAYETYLRQKKRLDDAIDPLIAARKATKQKCMDWDTEQERIRQDAQRKAEAEAKARAEQEALDAAVAAEQSGDKETAEAIISEPVYVAPVIVPKSSPAPSRLSAGRTIWSAEGIDIVKLCKAVAEGRASKEFVMFNLPALNRIAGAMKETMNVDGVRAVSKKV